MRNDWIDDRLLTEEQAIVPPPGRSDSSSVDPQYEDHEPPEFALEHEPS